MSDVELGVWNFTYQWCLSNNQGVELAANAAALAVKRFREANK